MKDKKKIANVIEGAVIVLFGVLVAIFGGSIIILLIDKLIYKIKLALTIDKC